MISVFLTDMYTATLTVSTSLVLYLYMDIQNIKWINEWMNEWMNVVWWHIRLWQQNVIIFRLVSMMWVEYKKHKKLQSISDKIQYNIHLLLLKKLNVITGPPGTQYIPVIMLWKTVTARRHTTCPPCCSKLLVVIDEFYISWHSCVAC